MIAEPINGLVTAVPVGLLLAAGSGSRFGADKLQQSLPNGLWLAQQACRNLVLGIGRVVAVVRSESELAERLRAEGAEVVVCADAEGGMGISLACGVRHAWGAGGWLIALADMPWIEPETIRSVAGALRSGAAIAAPVFEGRRGHPVGFGREFGARLAALQGDEGAKSLLRAHADQLRSIDCRDPGILRDVDVPADLPEGSSGREYA